MTVFESIIFRLEVSKDSDTRRVVALPLRVYRTSTPGRSAKVVVGVARYFRSSVIQISIRLEKREVVYFLHLYPSIISTFSNS